MHSLRQDIWQKVSENWKAGLTVALISTPLSIALSIASGAGPLPGLITGIWATAIAAVFASSNYNIIGPAGALTTVLFASTLVAPLGLGAGILPFLAIATGLILIGAWALNLDRFLYYIPSSVMYGFAAGVAILIAVSQLFDATGLSALKRTGHLIGDLELFSEHLSGVSVASLVTCIAFLAGILIWKRVVKNIPAVIPAAFLGIAWGFIESNFFNLDLISLGEKFGNLSATLALPLSGESLGAVLNDGTAMLWIFKAAALIALIAVLETLITAKIGDKLTRTQSSTRREVFGLALANLGSGFMGGLPATGVFIRTGANIKAGATHRTSAFLAAMFTAILSLFVLPFFSFIPVAVIAAILINTALGLIETHKFVEFWKHEKESFVIAVLVALITIVEDAGIAVGVGAVLAILLFADKISRGRFDAFFNYPDGHTEDVRGGRVLELPDGQLASVTYSIAGYVGYIDSARHADNLRTLTKAKNVSSVILRLRDLFSLDYEAQEMLRDAIVELKSAGKHIYITSARHDISKELNAMPGIRENIENDDVSIKTSDALAAIRKS